MTTVPGAVGSSPALVPDCGRCAGLCCVALPFAASADFALDKAAGVPCPNLGADFRCGIHDRLRDEGFGGCVAFDCQGAGQQVTQVTFGGRDWRSDPSIAVAMFDAFRVVRQLHELLWLLGEAARQPEAMPVRGDVDAAVTELTALVGASAAKLVALDLDAIRGRVGPILQQAGDLVRSAAPGGPGEDLRGADLLGRDLRRRVLRAADLRGACLVGADLRGVDLRGASLLGTDIRGADLRGADLADALYLTGSQLAAAVTDETTRS